MPFILRSPSAASSTPPVTDPTGGGGSGGTGGGAPTSDSFGVDPSSIGPSNAPAQPYGTPTVTISPSMSASTLTATIAGAAPGSIIQPLSGTYHNVDGPTLSDGKKIVWDTTMGGTHPVFDGQLTRVKAITTTTNNAVYGVEVTGYVTSGYQSPAVGPNPGDTYFNVNPFATYIPGNAHDLNIAWCDIHGNGSNTASTSTFGVAGGLGVYLPRNSSLTYTKLNNNGYEGYLGTDHNITLHHCEISWNNSTLARTALGLTGHFDAGDEAGGGKLAEGVGRYVSYNYVHHNQGVGIWFDTNNYDVWTHHNHVAYNTWESIFLEISGNALIENNLVEYGCWGDTGTTAPYVNCSLSNVGGCRNDNYFGAGVEIVNSGGTAIRTPGFPPSTLDTGYGTSGNGIGVTVRNNTVQHCRAGIIAKQDNRSAYVVNHVNVYSNTVIDTGINGLYAPPGDFTGASSLDHSDIVYRNQTYQQNRGPYVWLGSTYTTFTAWQAAGHDVGSTAA